MKISITTFFSISILISCKTGSHSNTIYNADKRNDLSLRLHVTSGESISYHIVSQNIFNVELNSKKIDNSTKADVTVNYNFRKDSADGFLMNIDYIDIRLHSKNGDDVIDADAANADSSTDQMEKMLGLVKTANISAQLGPLGEIRAVNGYKELGSKIVDQFTGNDINSKKVMQAKWDQVIGEGMIKKNITDLFSFFPKKSIYEGDSWTVHSVQKTDIPLSISTTYMLESIEDSIGYLKSNSDISTDSTVNYMGTDVVAMLKGSQEGKFTINMNTGMLVNSHSSLDVKGTIQILGRDFPVKISSDVTLNELNNR